MVKLSILICHLSDREQQLNKLMECLNKQKTDEVEIIVQADDGSMERGRKRNLLMYKARGDYISYVDDDDLVSDGTEHPAYIPTILKAIEKGQLHDTVQQHPDGSSLYVPIVKPGVKPDCIGIEGLIRFGDHPEPLFTHTMKCSIEWYTKMGAHYRSPNHLNPVKRSIAMQARFDDNMDWSEDHDYARRLRPLIKTEVYLGHPIYYYIK